MMHYAWPRSAGLVIALVIATAPGRSVYGQTTTTTTTTIPAAGGSATTITTTTSPAPAPAAVPAPLPAPAPAAAAQTGKATPLAIDLTKPTNDGTKLMGVAGLAKYGFGIGVAAAFISPWEMAKSSKVKEDQKEMVVTAMPYITALPGYWIKRGDITRAFCTHRAITLDPKGAQQAADAAAVELAKQDYRADLLDTETPDCTKQVSSNAAAQKQWKDACEVISGALVNAVDIASSTSLDAHLTRLAKQVLVSGAYAPHVPPDDPNATAAENLAAREAAKLSFAKEYELREFRNALTVYYKGWALGVRGDCAIKRLFGALGLYFGIPVAAGYSARFQDKDSLVPIRALDVKPRFSFGLAIAPVPYINFLIGVSRISVIRPGAKDDILTTPRDERANRHLTNWQYTFALGSTFDILGALWSIK